MQQLQVIEHNNMRVLTTKQISSAFGSTDKIVMRNFQRNQDRYEIGKHYFALSGEDLIHFKASRQNDVSLKYVSNLYLWTELGAWMHAKSLNNDRAWEAYQMLIDNYYVLASKQMILEGGNNLTPPLDEKRLYQIESRLMELEQQFKDVVTLHSGEQKRIRNAVSERVYKLAPNQSGARPALFSAIYSEIRERYSVNSYRDIKQYQLQEAIQFVEGWGGTCNQ
ncbi:ORF6N domain-containing protein [Sporosarcina cyprini]|uniref:ORF6N domain-containing protein n=1 Tax=Sporosarcina cyprini TaxID=2910523 RepID=UPI001EDE0010|nr:ORF6N domain-containing protein [Sporosarcina cyprini]MCG3089162.1 ORF6N domain-containing protein [Sporosarcina cyprini]